LAAVAEIEGEIATLEKRREQLQAKFDVSNNSLELSRIDRRNHLINSVDDNDAEVAQKIDAAILAGERDAAALSDALDALGSRLIDAKHRLEAAAAGDALERRAAALERAANEIQTRAQALEKATDALAVAASEFVSAIPDDVGLVIDANGFGPNAAATPAELAAAVISQGLAMSSPSLFENRKPNSRILRGVGCEKALSVRVLDGNGRLSNFFCQASAARKSKFCRRPRR
jgi:hypothetical protein